MGCTYTEVMAVLRRSITRVAKRNQYLMVDAVFASAQSACDKMINETSASRWVTGARKVPMWIVDYYSASAAAAQMYQDIVDGVMPYVIDPDRLAGELLTLVEKDTSIGPTMRQQLLRHRLDGDDGDLAALLTDIIIYAIQI